MSRRAWVNGLTALALVIAGAVTWQRVRDDCGAAVTSLPASESSSPFLDAEGMREQPDENRDALVRALASAPAPIGPVLGAVGYHYEQWAQVSALDQGLGVRTRNNPDFTMLDDRSLRPRWSVAVDTPRSTYDAGAGHYLVGTTPRNAPPELVLLDAETGERRWCVGAGGSALLGRDALATEVLDDGGVLLLRPTEDGAPRLARLAGRDGSTRWETSVAAGDGDFVGRLGDDLVLAGGTPRADLLDPGLLADRAEGPALAAVSSRTGERRWEVRTGAGQGLHVLAADPDTGLAVLEEWNAENTEGRLYAIDRRGDEVWSVRPPATPYFDATVRSGRVLVRAGARWAAYDSSDGRRLWSRTIPDRPQFLPYGFELADVPLLDADHVLIGGTTGLHTMDLRTGSFTTARLPTDGINTTYWPYQVTVTADAVAVATNTGAVVVRREDLS